MDAYGTVQGPRKANTGGGSLLGGSNWRQELSGLKPMSAKREAELALSMERYEGWSEKQKAN